MLPPPSPPLPLEHRLRALELAFLRKPTAYCSSARTRQVRPPGCRGRNVGCCPLYLNCLIPCARTNDSHCAYRQSRARTVEMGEEEFFDVYIVIRCS